MKKLFVLFLCAAIALNILVSCDRTYDEDEVKAAAQVLLENSKTVNEIFYGKGLGYDEESELTYGIYSPADEEHLAALGVSNTEGLKTLTKRVYTNELCEIIFSTRLSSVKDTDGEVKELRRYYDGKFGDSTVIMVYTEAFVNYDNDIDYLYETLTVMGADGEYINIEVDVLLTSIYGETRTVRAEFSLLEEENGFRLDTLSFVKY